MSGPQESLERFPRFSAPVFPTIEGIAILDENVRELRARIIASMGSLFERDLNARELGISIRIFESEIPRFCVAHANTYEDYQKLVPIVTGFVLRFGVWTAGMLLNKAFHVSRHRKC